MQGVRTVKISGGRKTSATILAQTHAAVTGDDCDWVVVADVAAVVGGRVDDVLLLGGGMLGVVIGG